MMHAVVLLAALTEQASPFEARAAATSGFLLIDEETSDSPCSQDCSMRAAIPFGLRVEAGYRTASGFGFGAAARGQNYGWLVSHDLVTGTIADAGGVVSWSWPRARRGSFRVLADIVVARISPTRGASDERPRVSWGWDVLIERSLRTSEATDAPSITLGGGLTSLRATREGRDRVGIIGFSFLVGVVFFL